MVVGWLLTGLPAMQCVLIKSLSGATRYKSSTIIYMYKKMHLHVQGIEDFKKN